MDLQKFVKEQHKLLDKFECEWERLHKKKPAAYPIQMEAGDWDRQFEAWMITKENEK